VQRVLKDLNGDGLANKAPDGWVGLIEATGSGSSIVEAEAQIA
jgi:hypothetical protein